MRRATSINVPAAGENLGTAVSSSGVVTVSSTAPYFPGAEAWLSGTLLDSVHVLILKILSSTTMKVKAIADSGSNVNQLNYLGGGNFSQFGVPAGAEKDFSTVGSGAFDTTIMAASNGGLGNEITIALVGDSGLGDNVTIDRTGSAFTIHFEDGVSTVADVEAAISALTGDDQLIVVWNPGTGATVLSAATDEFGATALAGGFMSRIDMPTQSVRIDRAHVKHNL